MKAVILAAGRGGRLAGVTGNHPKCLARVGESTLIERQMHVLRDNGIRQIAVVTGYQAGEVRRACGAGVEFVHNSRYSATNSLFSLWLARGHLADGFVVLNSDVVFHRQMMADLLTARYEDALLFAPKTADTPYSDEEMKVRVRGGQIVEIAKTIHADDADGENVGIAKFGRAGAAALVEEMTRLVRDGATRAWLPEAFAAFSRRRPLRAIDNRGFPWIEIDFPEDYWRACTEVLPAIEAADEDPVVPLAASASAAAASWRPSHV